MAAGYHLKPMADYKPRPGNVPAVYGSLSILARQAQQSLPMFDLQTLGGLAPSRYAQALKSLRNAGYIAIGGEAPEQAIRPTGRGAEVIRLARPA